jgi:hypothetical protein
MELRAQSIGYETRQLSYALSSSFISGTHKEFILVIFFKRIRGLSPNKKWIIAENVNFYTNELL